MRLNRILIGIISICFLPAMALAQEYPSKTVSIIVAFPPGGDADIFARIFAQQFIAKSM